jgi:hypothetical protein
VRHRRCTTAEKERDLLTGSTTPPAERFPGRSAY